MKVMIFGGAGFVGRNLGRRCIEEGHGVTTVDNLCVAPAEPAPSGVYIYKEDVCDRAAMMDILKREVPDVIFWLAAKQGYHRDWSTYSHTNNTALYNLFNGISAVRGIYKPKVVIASSQAVYHPTISASETDLTDPPSIYGWTKLQAEMSALWLARHIGLRDMVVLRYSIILGAGQSLQSSESGLLRNWYRAYQEGRPIQVYGTGKHIRDFVSIDDVTEANMKAMEHDCTAPGPQAFNIHGFEASILKMVDLFKAAVFARCTDNAQISTNVMNEEVRPGGEYSLTSCGDKALAHFGWKPEKEIYDQIVDFLDKLPLRNDNPVHETSSPG